MMKLNAKENRDLIKMIFLMQGIFPFKMDLSYDFSIKDNYL